MDKYTRGIAATELLWAGIEAPVTAPVAAIPVWQAACDIAAGRAKRAADAEPATIRGACRDVNFKCRGDEWYRMVLRGSWQYVTEERLPKGKFLPSERGCWVAGSVFIGEIVVQHDLAKPIDCAYLVIPGEKCLKSIEFKKRRDGQLAFILPDDVVVIAANPHRCVAARRRSDRG